MWTINTVTPWNITLVNDQGETMTIGYKKNAILFFRLIEMKIGDKIEIATQKSDVASGYSGNHFPVFNDTFQIKQLEATEFELRKARVNKLKGEL